MSLFPFSNTQKHRVNADRHGHENSEGPRNKVPPVARGVLYEHISSYQIKMIQVEFLFVLPLALLRDVQSHG